MHEYKHAVSETSLYLGASVDGAILKPEDVGLPNKFEVLDE